MYTRLYPTPGDPFAIRVTTAQVMAETTDVRIDQRAVTRVARRLVDAWGDPPAWDDTLHFRGTPEQTAGWIVVLDALNYCFWPQGEDPAVRWRVTWRGKTHDGYDALAAALHRAIVDDGSEIWDPAWLRDIPLETVAHALRGDEGCPSIPLLRDRMVSLRDMAMPRHQRDARPADIAIDARGSADRVVRLAIRRYLMYEDTSVWRRRDGIVLEVPLLKRAQILAADLAGALAGTELALTTDLELLTAFADYKVPQVLRHLGVLRYAEPLARRIHRRERIPAHHPWEVAIRAGTVQACERLVAAIRALGRETTAAELDWRLWTLGQSLPGDVEPYHRTETTSY
jgi:hypothetical protein